MSDIKLFSLANSQAEELKGETANLERDLQQHIEAHMPTYLGIRFLASEYSTGKTHKGRIDSLGLDENGCPVIIEYKRGKHDNVITQGLFYLDWLLDHQAELQLLVMKALGSKIAEAIEWSGTRLICIASDFNKYDEHAVQQMHRNIELMRYRYFKQSSNDDLLLLELVNAQSVTQDLNSKSVEINAVSPTAANNKKTSTDKTQEERYNEASTDLKGLFDALCFYVDQLGDEVQRKNLKLYTAFKRIKNFVCIVMMPNKDPRLTVTLNLPGSLADNDSFSRDISNIGHWGTGDLALSIRTIEDLEKAKAWIDKSYESR